jgi:hypothetical protein
MIDVNLTKRQPQKRIRGGRRRRRRKEDFPLMRERWNEVGKIRGDGVRLLVLHRTE